MRYTFLTEALVPAFATPNLATAGTDYAGREPSISSEICGLFAEIAVRI